MSVGGSGGEGRGHVRIARRLRWLRLLGGLLLGATLWLASCLDASGGEVSEGEEDVLIADPFSLSFFQCKELAGAGNIPLRARIGGPINLLEAPV